MSEEPRRTNWPAILGLIVLPAAIWSVIFFLAYLGRLYRPW